MTREELKNEIKSLISEMNINLCKVDTVEEECLAFVNESFLGFVNESFKSDKAELDNILEKMNPKNIKNNKESDYITDKDIKRAIEIIKKISEYDNKEASKYYGLFLSSYTSCIASIMLVATGSEVLLPIGLSVGSGASICLLISSFMIASNIKNSILTMSKLNNYYDRIMKIEAKAKVKLKKLSLDDDAEDSNKKVKYLKTLIANCDKLRSNYKKFVSELENSEKTNNRYGFKECFTITESGEVEYLNEMKGDQLKIELFKQITDDCDEVFRDRYEYITTISKNIKECLNKAKSISNKEDAAKTIVELKQKLRDFNEENKSNENLKSKAIRDLTSNINKFTVKYTFESLKVKKALAAKIEKYHNEIYNIGKEFDTETGSLNKEIYKVIDQLELSDSFGENSNRMISQFEPIINSWQKGIVTMCNNTLKDSEKILKILGVEKTEKSIIFKILNRKERKAEKEK